RREDEEQTAGFVLSFQVIAGILLILLAFAAADPVARFFGNPVLAPALRVLSLSYLLAPFAGVPLARLEKALDYRGKVLVDLGGAAAQTLVVVALALAGLGLWSFVWGML